MDACYDDFGGKARVECNKNGSFDCAVFFYNDEVVWEGPVLLRDQESGQLLPCNGVWDVRITGAGADYGGVRLFARLGKLSAYVLQPGGRCPVGLKPVNSRTGHFGVSCRDGSDFRGVYTLDSHGSLIGKGGLATLKVQLNQGRMLIPAEYRGCPGCNEGTIGTAGAGLQ